MLQSTGKSETMEADVPRVINVIPFTYHKTTFGT